MTARGEAPLKDLSVAAAYKQFLDTRQARRQRGKDNKVDHLKERSERPILEAVLATLRAYQDPENVISFPKEIAFYIADEIETILTGQLPSSWKTLLKRGRQDLPSQISDKRSAVRYILACREGVNQEKSPVPRIIQWFDCREGTVYRWLREAKKRGEVPKDFPEPWQIVKKYGLGELMAAVEALSEALRLQSDVAVAGELVGGVEAAIKALRCQSDPTEALGLAEGGELVGAVEVAIEARRRRRGVAAVRDLLAAVEALSEAVRLQIAVAAAGELVGVVETPAKQVLRQRQTDPADVRGRVGRVHAAIEALKVIEVQAQRSGEHWQEYRGRSDWY